MPGRGQRFSVPPHRKLHVCDDFSLHRLVYFQYIAQILTNQTADILAHIDPDQSDSRFQSSTQRSLQIREQITEHYRRCHSSTQKF